MAGIAGMGQPQDISTDAQYQAPVPNVQVLAQQAQDQAQPAPMQPQAPPDAAPQAQARPSLDDIFSGASKPSLDDIFGSADAQVPEDKGMLYDNTIGLPQQLSDLPTRAKASFAVTDKERLSVLKQRFDDAKMVTKDDHKVFMVKDAGTWRRFGSSNEILGDAADFGRQALETGVQAGTTAGALALTGATDGVMSPVAAAAIGGGSTLLAKKTGDVVAQNVLGIPRDASRSELLEDTLTTGVGSLLSGGVQMLTNRIARNAALGKLNQAGVDATQQVIKDNLSDAQKLQQAGVIANIPGSDTPILAHEAANNPELLRQSIGWERQVPEYRQMQEARASNIEDGARRLIANFGNSEVESAGLHPRFQQAVKDIDSAEGALLGSYRDMASRAGNRQPLAANSYQSAVTDLAKRMGFNIDSEQSVLNAPSTQDIIRKGIVSTQKEAAQLLQDMNGWLEDVHNSGGKMPYDDMLGELKAIQTRINRTSVLNGTGLQHELIGIKNGIRDDVNSWTGNLLQNFDPEAGANYTDALKRFSSLKSASDDLGTLLKGDSLSQQAFSDKLFYGQKAPGFLDAVKTILGKQDPMLWEDLKGAFLNNRIADARDPVTGRINWTQFNNDIFHPTKGVGPEVLKHLFDSPKDAKLSADIFEKFGKFAATFNQRALSNMAPQAQEKLIQEFGMKAFEAMHGRPQQIIRLLTSVVKSPEENHIVQYITKNGTEQALGIMPKNQQGVWRKVFDGMVKLNTDAAKNAIPR